MRNSVLLVLVVVLSFLVLSGIAPDAKAEKATQRNAEVIADEAAGVVRVMIHGKEVAHFDEYGLHVINDIVSTTGAFYFKVSPRELRKSGGER